MRLLVLIALLTGLLTACGRYGTPLPPEALSPASVQDLTATPLPDGVHFAWRSPDANARNEELKEMTSYRVYRLILPIDELDEDESEEEFELIGTIADEHLEILRKEKKKAREEGRSTRKVSIDPALSHFEFKDKDLEPGRTYLYQIIPVNQGDVEGQTQQTVRVQYRGLASTIRLLGQNVDPLAAGEVPQL